MLRKIAIATFISSAVLCLAPAALADDSPQTPTAPGSTPNTSDAARDAANRAASAQEESQNRAVQEQTGGTANVNGQSLTANTSPKSPSARFGRQEQLAFSSDEALMISSTTENGVSGSTTTVQLGPAIDWFLFDNFSLGGFTEFNYVSAGGGHVSTIGFGPRVGYNFSMSDLLSIWPKVGLSIDNTSVSTPATTSGSPAVATGTASASGTSVALNLYVPIMFHPVPHFFAGFGPFLDTDFSGNPQLTTWGGKLTLGGWVGW